MEPLYTGHSTKDIQPFLTPLLPSSHTFSSYPSGNENALTGYFKYTFASSFFADWEVWYTKMVLRCLCDKWEDIDWDAWQDRRNTVMCMQNWSERRGGRHLLFKWVAAAYKPNWNKKHWRIRGLTEGASAVCTVTEGSNRIVVGAGLKGSHNTFAVPSTPHGRSGWWHPGAHAAASRARADKPLHHRPQQMFWRHCASLRSCWLVWLCIPIQTCKYDSPEWKEEGCLLYYYTFSLRFQGRHCIQLYFYWMKTENICKWLKW